MRKRLIFAAVIFLLTILIAYNNCSQTHFNSLQNTSTSVGNPMTQSAKTLLLSVCGTLTRCNSQLTMEACEGGILGAAGFAVRLGLPTSFTTFSEIMTAEQSSLIAGSSAATTQCTSAIDNLSCTSTQVQSAYDPTLSNPFANSSGIVPPDLTSGCPNVFSPVVSAWKLVDGASTNGINLNSSRAATRPQSAVVNTKFYATWGEANTSGISQVRASVYNGDDIQPAWNFVDGHASAGLNYSASQNADFPQAASLNNKLYVLWSEPNSSNVAQMRAKVYNGNDSSPSWSFVDGNGANGINGAVTQPTTWPSVIVFNSQLFAGWEELRSGVYRVYVKAYNGNDAAPAWSDATGSAGGYSVNGGPDAGLPAFASFNSKLYMTFTETSPSTGKKQVRAAVFNGNVAAPQWSPVDGGGANGLNKNTALDAQTSALTAFNSKLYVTWTETNSSGVKQIRAAVYNGNDGAPAWAFVDGGGANGLNANTAQGAASSSMLVQGGRLYLAWSEVAVGRTNFLSRVAVYNGNDSAPSWAFVDGGGLNYNSNQDTYSVHWMLFNSKPYLMWQEYNGTASNIRAAVGSP